MTKSFFDKLAEVVGVTLLFRGLPRSLKLGFMVGIIGSLAGVALFWRLRDRG